MELVRVNDSNFCNIANHVKKTYPLSSFLFNNYKIDLIKLNGDKFDGIYDKKQLYYKSNCPLNKECNRGKTFTISNVKNIFYCFNCKIGGDALVFIGRIDDINQNKSLEKLIKIYGITEKEVENGI